MNQTQVEGSCVLRSRAAVHRALRSRAILHRALLVGTCTALLLLGVCEAFAADETPAVSTSDKARITREHSYGIGETTPYIEERLVGEDGTVYLLKELSDSTIDASSVSQRSFSLLVERPVSVEMHDEGESAIRNRFDQLLSVDTGEFVGTLRLRNLVSEPVYRTSENQVERTVVIPDLPSEDVAQLPTTGVFSVASDTGLDATVDKELQRLAVTWETTGFDAFGRPANFQATVIYRGIERELLVDYYRVTATYTGVLLADPQSQTVIATYEAEEERRAGPADTLPIIKPVTIAETAVPLASAAGIQLPFIAIAAAAMIVMLMALLFLLYFFLYKNARLVRLSDAGRRKVLERKHLRLEEGELIFKVDPSHQLYQSEVSHQIVLSNRLAQQQGQLLVFWGDRLILCTNLKRETNITEELVKSVSEGFELILNESPSFGSQLLEGE